jgi:hypothetical protein
MLELTSFLTSKHRKRSKARRRDLMRGLAAREEDSWRHCESTDVVRKVLISDRRRRFSAASSGSGASVYGGSKVRGWLKVSLPRKSIEFEGRRCFTYLARLFDGGSRRQAKDSLTVELLRTTKGKAKTRLAKV